MPKPARIKDKVFARGVDHISEDLNRLCEKHNIPPANLVRGLLEAAVEFYRKHGWFTFPVRIEPEAFQARYVAEERALYEAGRAEIAKQPTRKK